MVDAQPYYYWWTHAYHIKIMAPHTPVASIIVCEEDTLLLAMFNLLHNSMNQKLFEKTSVIEVPTMKDFCHEWKPSCAYKTFHGA